MQFSTSLLIPTPTHSHPGTLRLPFTCPVISVRIEAGFRSCWTLSLLFPSPASFWHPENKDCRSLNSRYIRELGRCHLAWSCTHTMQGALSYLPRKMSSSDTQEKLPQYPLAGIAVVRCHRLGNCHSRSSCPHHFGDRKSMITCLHVWFLLRLLTFAYRWPPSHCVLTWLSLVPCCLGPNFLFF